MKGSGRRVRHVRLLAPWISAWRDGELGRLRALWLGRHLRGCAACQAVLRDLEAQDALFKGLRAPPPPAPDTAADFAALMAALAASPPAPLPWWQPWLRGGRPLVAAAALSVAAVLLVLRVRPELVLGPRPSPDRMIWMAEEQFHRVEVDYARAVESLQRAAARRQAGWSAQAIRDHQAALLALAAEVERCRDAARAQPSSGEAQERLYLAYERQIAYLQSSLRRRPSASVALFSEAGAP